MPIPTLATKKILPRPVISKQDRLGDLHPILKRIFQTRGVVSMDELDHSLSGLPQPWALSGMEKTVSCLIDAIDKNLKILIIGDYDADGATSCAVAIKGLRMLGAANVSFLVPNRFEYGYGLTPEIIELAKSNQPDVLITVDNGVSSIDGVAAAKKLGMTVLITDHHLPGEILPEADAIVNPNLPGETFPGATLAGVGVIFYVLLALRNRLRDLGRFSTENAKEPNLAQLLDLVALGTIADVVPLERINRILVHQGLIRIRSGRCNTGLKRLIEMSGRNNQMISASDLGFAIGPRLNAAGRMDDMGLGIECLLTEDYHLAGEMALQLDELNSDRRAVEEKMKSEALTLLQDMKILNESHLPSGVCLFDKEWHQGVIGILASRIKDKLHRPVIAFAPGENGQIKGSARSIPGLHIRDVLSDIASSHPKLLNKFGGHAMAAGLSLKLTDYPVFALVFDEVVGKKLKHIDLTHSIFSDGELTENEISIPFAELIQNYGPWGQEFPEPQFDGVFDVIQARIVGRRHLKLVLRLPFSEMLIDAIGFFVDNPESWLGIRQLRTVYKLDINEYKGQRNVQLVLQYLEKMA